MKPNKMYRPKIYRWADKDGDVLTVTTFEAGAIFEVWPSDVDEEMQGLFVPREQLSALIKVLQYMA